MAFISDEGKIHATKRLVSDSAPPMSYIAVGSGEIEKGDTSLDERLFVASRDTDAVSFSSTESGLMEGKIDISGGVEIEPGVDVSEIAVYYADPRNNEDVLVFGDTFTGVEVKSGIIESFVIRASF